MKNKQICVSVLLLFLAAAVPAAPAAGQPQSTSQVLAMDNPAAVYCTDAMGYEYQIVDDADGGQRGVCVLPGGQACDQWDFYAGACGQEFGYCAQQGYQTETRTDGQDPFASSYAVCVSPEGQPLGPVMQLVDLGARAACAAQEQPVIDTDVPPPQIGPAAPSSFDWRSYAGVNWLTGVRNQGGCGSCWAFAAVGVVEAHYNIVKNNPNLDLNLAEQDLVSCSSAGGCSGGSSSSALRYIRDSGIIDEGCMPYTAKDSPCNRCSNWQNRLTYIDEVYNFSPTRNTLRQAVFDYGPVYVYMGIGSEFGGYFDGSGIYRCTDDSGINHAVVIVGYNDAGGYWIVRNSWGSSWNGNGYFKVGYGECAIDSDYAGYTYLLPPTKASNVRPDGWSGPYTADATPSFRWDAASDAGSGMAGYYVAVDDWTPEGGSGNDWWVGNVTAFTAPNALPDGQHHFAVTSRDRFGNVNPTNTNLQGDAPYYTFYVDTTPPASAVSALAAEQSSPSFTVRWGGSDATSGIVSYDVQYRYGADGSWITWISGSSAASAIFEAQQEGVYYFRSRARDRAGNIEPWPGGNGDAFTYAPLYRVYLPLAMRTYSPPAIVNGNFESGAAGWTQYSLQGWPLIVNSSSLPMTPYQGNWAAWLGGDDDEICYLSQQVTVPANQPYLTWRQWIDSQETTCGWDEARILVNGAVVRSFGLCDATNTGRWVPYSLNLSAYRGRSVSLQIRVDTDSSLNSNLFMDDISFQAAPLAAASEEEIWIDQEASMPKTRSGENP